MILIQIARVLGGLYGFAALIYLFCYGLGLTFDPTPYTSLISIYLLLQVLLRIGYEMPYLELTVFLYHLQLIAANYWLNGLNIPLNLFEYSVNTPESYYQGVYLQLAVFSLSIFMVKAGNLGQWIHSAVSALKENPKINILAWRFFILGGIFLILNRYVPNIPTFKQFLTYFESLFLMSGVLFYLSSHRMKYFFMAIVYTVSILNAMQTTLFYSIINGLLLLFFIHQIIHPYRLVTKLILLVFTIGMISIIQISKSNARRSIPGSGRGYIISANIYKGIQAVQSTTHFLVFTPFLLQRLNQAYFDVMVYRKISNTPDYLRKKTMGVALVGAFIPRAIWKSKPKFDNSVLRELAGYRTSTSYISVSVWAEAASNFGLNGSLLFIMLFGAGLAAYFNYLVFAAVRKYPYLLLFIPLIYENIVRIEVHFTQAIYTLVSATFFAVVIVLYLNKSGIRFHQFER